MCGSPTSPGSDRLRGGRVIAGSLAVLLLLGGVAVTEVATPTPAEAAATTVAIDGHGFGHGRGMGQWGAYGFATNHGWNYRQILDHYYSNTAAGGVAGGQNIPVWLTARDFQDLWVTSTAPFYVGHQPIEAGKAVHVWRDANTGGLQAAVHTSCTGAPERLYTPGDGVAWSPTATPMRICGSVAYRGQLVLFWDGVGRLLRTTNYVAVEDYLQGVVPRESPSGWPAAALQAQAVAARSYALAEGGESGLRWWFAKTCDDTRCQVYGGVDGEQPTTNAAVVATANEVRRFTDNALARTEFSSSTGGWSAGGVFPAVPDAGDASSPYHDWTITLNTADLEARYQIGSFIGIEIISRNGLGDWGGRVGSLRIRGSQGSVVRSGGQFRSDWGLRSDWIYVRGALTVWNFTAVHAPTPVLSVAYGLPTYQPLLCDWDGDGDDTVGFVDRGVWALRNSNTPGYPEIVFPYGDPSWIPICGDWDGDGDDTIGAVANGNVWALRNSNTPGYPEIVFVYGQAGGVPVPGDWDGNGADGPGMYVQGVWQLKNAVAAGWPDATFRYGVDPYRPIVGDWNNDSYDTVGFFVGGSWRLKNLNSPGWWDIAFDGLGTFATVPLAGDHDGNNVDTAVALTPG